MYCYKNDGTKVWLTKDVNDSNGDSSYWIGDGASGSVGCNHTFEIDASNPNKYSEKGQSGNAENLYSSSYTTPLYLGYFIDPNSYRPSYNNFYWMPNLAQTSGNNGSNSDAAVQKLTDNTLNAAGLVQKDGIALPYFSSAWADAHSSVMKYWESDGTTNISFPFYETLAETSSGSAQYAKYYQFNSKDSTLLFYENNTTPAKSFFTESDTPIRDTYGNNAFFPYTQTDSWHTNSTDGDKNDPNADNYKRKKNGEHTNYGFGSSFEMTFKLGEHGMTDAVDMYGKKITTGTVAKVPTVFEFNGDDDLWVFIDGHLVLDIGGAHGASSGTINFATAKATVTKSVTYSDTNKDSLDDDSLIKNNAEESLVGKVNGLTMGGSTPTYDNSVHTMKIFYMERGMAQSNLYIRYNFVPEANYSKMKIKEQTDFSGVNTGLKALTQKAAENDVFKYTVENSGTDASDVSENQYTNSKTYTRNVQGVSTPLPTKVTDTTQKFNPTNNNVVVSNVGYNWVDEYAFSNGTKMDSMEGVGGVTGNNGELYLMHGIAKDATLSPSDEVKSSAEFEGQFSRYSTMTIVQDSALYKYDSSKTPTLSGTSDRSVNTYYTTTKSIFSTIPNTTATLADDVNSFKFRNNINTSNVAVGDAVDNPDTGSGLSSAVQMTELFTNTVNTGTLKIKKKVTGTTTLNEFTFKVTFEDVFGVDTVDLGSNDYGNIVIIGSNNASGKLNADGTFNIAAGATATISGIPVGTKFTVTEIRTGLQNCTVSDEITASTENRTIQKDQEFEVEITNAFRSETGVDVLKKNSNGDPLDGAEFELWYKETVPPQTYSFNEPKIAPNEINGMKVTETPASVGVPSPVVPKSVTNYTVTTTYTDPSVPNADEEEWILPRNDTDYIYFRDYNTGTPGWEDSASFNDTGKDAANTNGSDGKRSWRGTEFDRHTGHSQNLELFFDDNDTYWMAAEFSGNGKKTIRYAMWERFVDKYDIDGNNTEDVLTTVWKIQPPDGYTQVKFMMLSGDTVIRESQTINYELGKIYHKTDWGKWTKRNGIDSYYDVPVVAESGYWAPSTSDTVKDKRNTGSAMDQARKYEPTAQKVIFHCNSDNVWHNIHIEFFEDAQGNNRVNGQAFPGYMMEPFAYAGNNYRLGNYLTYELTIPANAKYFRINNGEAPSTYHGETSGTYSYQTAIMPLKNATTGEGQKNYGNYWCFGSYSDTGATLVQWTTPTNEENGGGSIPAKDYKNAEVTSDYDYIYFKNTANWSKVYAYFYAGGDLRGDNWQRATYSSWPGVAPAGTEYGTVHSNTYTDHTTGDQYNGTTTGGTLNPVATFTSGGYKIYKFRIPKGDRKNYSKVIFNSGLGGTETGVIDYQPGHMYDKSGKSEKHYENSPTKLYTASTNSNLSGDDKTEYIYVKNTLSGWDDLHVTFYDANGGQILQGGKGYVMEYAGNSTNDYFKIPLPENAAMFSVNNGIGSANSSKVSQKADIIRYGDDGKAKSTKAGTDRFVYTLSGAGTSASPYTLTRDGFSTQSVAQTSRPTPQEEGFADYTVAVAATDTALATYSVRQHGTTPNIVEHTLNIRDAANWNVDIGRISVTFYKSDGSQIGPNVMIKTVADAQGKVWYTKKIHPDAVSFTVSYSVGTGTNPTTYTTPKYPIYPYSASAPADGSNYTSTGHMFFDTVGTGANSKLVMTHEEPVNADNAVDDETYSQRGDYLYLIYPANDSKEVTFYASGDNVIKSGIKAKYINHDSEGYWYKVAIPTGAQSFWATGMTDGTKAAIYELRAKYSPYRKDYTLGDMQYRISDGATLLYPVFTADTYNTLDVSTGNTISSRTPILVDEDAIADYQGAAATLPATTGGSSPTKEILYNTASDDVTYSWTEGEAADDMLRFEKPSDWSVPTTAAYYNGSTLVESKSFSLDSGSIYKVTVPNNTYDSVVITDGTHSTSTISLTSYNGGKNYKISRTTANTTYNDGKVRFDNSATQWSNVYVHFWNGSTESGTWYQMTDSDGDNIFEYTVPSGTYDHVRFSSDQSSSSNNPKTLALSRSNGGKNAKFTPDIDNTNIYFQVGSTPWGVHSSKIYAYYYDPGEYKTWGANCPEHKRDDEKEIHFEIGGIASTFKKLIVFGYENGTKWQSVSINVEGTPENGGGRIYKIKSDTDSNGHYNVEFLGYGSYPDNSGSWSSSGTVTTWPLTLYSSSTQTTYTYSYQPEDRYGMISDMNTTTGSEGVLGKADADNFIKVTIPTSITKLYIRFYDSSDAYIGTVASPPSGVTSSDKGLLLNGASMTTNGETYSLVYDDTVTSKVTYMVRLPKNAASFKIFSDTTETYT